MTKIIKVAPSTLSDAFSQARETIVSGGVIAYPTDTFYGLGADPNNASAVHKLFAIKGRRKDQPILLLISDPGFVDTWAAEITPVAERLMKEFWPGPLTLVFRAKKGMLPEITAGTGTVGLRMPGSPLTRRLLSYLGTALTGTSANISGEQSIASGEVAAAVLDGMVDLVLDGGMTEGGKPSTIVDVISEKIRIIREGAIPSDVLQQKIHL
jgi:L-threonylcarbamoyladenylate synthase